MPKRKWSGEQEYANVSFSDATTTSGVGGPRANDVLSGRGDNINKHPGNKYFRKLVEKKKELYSTSQFTREKRMISAGIVSTIRGLDPPGRFLSKDTNSGMWNEIGDEKAREKASQALREKTKSNRTTEVEAKISSKQHAQDDLINVERNFQPTSTHDSDWIHHSYYTHGYPSYGHPMYYHSHVPIRMSQQLFPQYLFPFPCQLSRHCVPPSGPPLRTPPTIPAISQQYVQHDSIEGAQPCGYYGHTMKNLSGTSPGVPPPPVPSPKPSCASPKALRASHKPAGPQGSDGTYCSKWPEDLASSYLQQDQKETETDSNAEQTKSFPEPDLNNKGDSDHKPSHTCTAHWSPASQKRYDSNKCCIPKPNLCSPGHMCSNLAENNDGRTPTVPLSTAAVGKTDLFNGSEPITSTVDAPAIHERLFRSLTPPIEIGEQNLTARKLQYSPIQRTKPTTVCRDTDLPQQTTLTHVAIKAVNSFDSFDTMTPLCS